MIVNPLTDINIFVKHLWASSISLNWRAPLHVAYELYVVLVLFYQNTMEIWRILNIETKTNLTWKKNKRKNRKSGDHCWKKDRYNEWKFFHYLIFQSKMKIPFCVFANQICHVTSQKLKKKTKGDKTKKMYIYIYIKKQAFGLST